MKRLALTLMATALAAAAFTQSDAKPRTATARAAPPPAAAPVPPPVDPADPFSGLEQVESPQSLAWVAAQNALTADRLEKDPRYEIFHEEALGIFTASDRIAWPTFRAGGLDNVWQDEEHHNGVWRHTTLASYRTATPDWTTVLDLDALSQAEGKSWFFKGATCLRPAQMDCLVRLSNGGGDSVEIREIDAATGQFVDGGFRFGEAKQNVDWLDADTLAVARDWGPGTLTDSGYAFVMKIVRRGQPLDQAREVFRGDKHDVSVTPLVLRGEDGVVDGVIAVRAVTFFEDEFYLLGERAATKLPLPRKSRFEGYVDGQLVFSLQEDWNGFRQGDLLSYNLPALKATPDKAQVTLIYRPAANQAVETVDATKGRLIVQGLEDVKGFVDVYKHNHKKGWSRTRLALPTDSNLQIRAAADDDDRLFVSAEGFLTPTTLWLADAYSGRLEQVKATPARFDGSNDVVEQFWTASTDGTRIPYFVVHRRDIKYDGSTPTIMFGYGGFEVSKPPVYLPEMGKLWLERGGAYVIANIRGGGEFGPAWHQAVLREHRQLAFDDFASVARDLFARKITSARRLGIYGRSNGGVLTSVSITQHPELWNAAVIESPLVDMLRYSHLSAGASWTGEYGDPDVPADRAFIARYSAYQNLRPGMRYPEPYITTNTKDDRVHPSHARKLAAKMEALGYPVLYYENTFGGHANDADPELNARRWARHYVYLSQKLMDEPRGR